MIYVLEDQGSRDYMEDRHYIALKFFMDYDLYCIFDGHGNDSIAKYLHLYFKDVLRNSLLSEEFETVQGMVQGFQNAFKTMHNTIPVSIGMNAGSTALVILQNSQEIWVANVGDCRAVMVKETSSTPMSIDHKPSLKSEYDRIVAIPGGFVAHDPMGTARVNGNLAVSRSFGDFSLSPMVTWVPDVFNFKIPPDYKFSFIASDGVYDVISTEEIYHLFAPYSLDDHESVKTACHKVLDTARSRGSGDNITIIIRK